MMILKKGILKNRKQKLWKGGNVFSNKKTTKGKNRSM